jgi:hypothetical protein
MQELVDVHFPKTECIRVVQDNLSTHIAGGALGQAFPPAEARRLLNRLEFHYVPKHASWLNMVETEIADWCAAKPMPGSAQRQQEAPRIRSRCLGAAAQYSTCPHKSTFAIET